MMEVGSAPMNQGLKTELRLRMIDRSRPFSPMICVVCLVLVSCGVAVLYVTNERLGQTARNFGNLVSDNLQDARTFIDNTVGVTPLSWSVSSAVAAELDEQDTCKIFHL